MYNVRHITYRRLWLFSGCLALLLTLMGLSLLLSTSSAHAASVQGCKETTTKGANGQITTINCGGEGQKTIQQGANGQPIPCVGGPTTIGQGANGQRIITQGCVCVEGQKTIQRVANGQRVIIQGCACVGGQKTIGQGANGQRIITQGCACVEGQTTTVGESCPVLPPQH